MRTITYLNPAGATITFGTVVVNPPDEVDQLIITSLKGIDVPTQNLQEQRAPFQDGSTYIDNLFDPREIEMDFTLAHRNNLEDIFEDRRIITEIINPKYGPGTLTYTNDYGTYRCTALPQGPYYPNKHATDPFQRGNIIFYAHDPYWYDLTPQTVSLQIVVPGLVFPITFPAAGLVFSTFVGSPQNCQNLGDVSTPLSIKMYGPATNPKLANTVSTEFLKINKTLSAGDLIEINTAFGQKTVYYTPAGGSRVNAINYLDLTSTFFQLAIGLNALQYTDDTSSATKLCFVEYYNRYIGV